jgi:electron transport complex protein RnfG
MKNIAKLILVLTVICSVSGALMALVNDLTIDKIAAANLAGKIEAMKKVLPEFDNNPIEDTAVITVGDAEWEFFIARQGGKAIGSAFVSTSPEGYGGDIHVMVGINAEDKIQAIEILKPLAETPGLGAKIEGAPFRGHFAGLSLVGTKWAVKKDGGQIPHITAATISSRAVVNAIKQGLDVYLAHKDEIIK